MSLQNILTFGFIISVYSLSGARGDLSPQKREAPETTCPSGWTFFSGGCYSYEDTNSSWDEAEIACIADESHLVEINSAAENTFLVNLIKNDSVYSFNPTWIGLNNRENDVTHIWYSSGNVTDYTNWDADQPNDVTGQACVQMYSTGLWNDTHCSLERHFICERLAEAICPAGWTFFRGGCYKYADAVSTWDDAEIACIADESHLVEITSAAENTFIVNLMKSVPSSIYAVWIGLDDREINGSHVWYSSGKVVNYTNWDDFQPNDVTGLACVQMYKSGLWNDMRCAFARTYICERQAKAICPPGWTFFRGECYIYNDNPTDWDKAEIACIADESHLVEITSAAENTFIVNLMKSVPSSIFAVWIGLDDREINGSHVWYSSGKIANYTNWEAFQPNDITGLACVQMYTSGLWNDMRCAFSRTYICERPAKAICPPGWTFFRGDCYIYNDNPTDWDKAEKSCNASEGHLTDITSATENMFLVKLMKSVSIYSYAAWIGLDDREINGTHVWVSTGNIATFTNWDAYQPNDVTGLACVQMYQSGLWNDMRCAFTRDYICERPARVTCEEGWSIFNRRCFKFIDKFERRDSAQNSCIANGGGLAQITGAADNSFLINLRKENDPYGVNVWIGLYKVDDTWIWYPSEKAASYLNWASGEPNYYQNLEECVELMYYGKWNDIYCLNYRKYFCEKPSIVVPY